MEVYAIDNGYFGTKAIGRSGRVKFRSKAQEAADDNLRNGMTMSYGNINYIVGHGKDDIEIDKTQKELHKICTLMGVGKLMEKQEEECKLVVALPLNPYRNVEFREEFRKYIAEPVDEEIKIGREIRKIHKKQVIVFAQTIAALHADPGKYRNKLTALFDMGGLTINGCVCEGLKPIWETAFTINYGTIVLLNKIKTEINRRRGYNIQDYEMEYIFDTTDPTMQKIIKESTDEHFDGVLREMRAKNWSIETLQMVGLGGGVLKTQPILTRYLKNLQISADPLFDNAKGLYNIGVVAK